MKDFEKVLRVFEGLRFLTEDTEKISLPDNPPPKPQGLVYQGAIFEDEINYILKNPDVAQEMMSKSVKNGLQNVEKELQNFEHELVKARGKILDGIDLFVDKFFGQDYNAISDSAFAQKKFSVLRDHQSELGNHEVRLAFSGGDGVNFTILEVQTTTPAPSAPLKESIFVENIDEIKKDFLIGVFTKYKAFCVSLRQSVLNNLQSNNSINPEVYSLVVDFINEYLFNSIYFYDLDVDQDSIQSFLKRFGNRDFGKRTRDLAPFFNPFDLDQFLQKDVLTPENLTLGVTKKGEEPKYVRDLAPDKVQDICDYLNIKLFFANVSYICDFFAVGLEARGGIGFSESGEGAVSLLLKQVEEISRAIRPCIIYGGAGMSPATAGTQKKTDIFEFYQVLPDKAQQNAFSKSNREKSDILVFIEKSLGDKIGIATPIKKEQANWTVVKLYILYKLLAGESSFAGEKYEKGVGDKVQDGIKALSSILNFVKDKNNENTARRLKVWDLFERFVVLRISAAIQEVETKYNSPEGVLSLYSRRGEEMERFFTKFGISNPNPDLPLGEKVVENFSKMTTLQKAFVVIGMEEILKISGVVGSQLDRLVKAHNIEDYAKKHLSGVQDSISSGQTVQLKRVRFSSIDEISKRLMKAAPIKGRIYLENKNKAVLKNLIQKIVDRKKMENLNN